MFSIVAVCVINNACFGCNLCNNNNKIKIINIVPVLRSFPKLTAAGPSGLRIQNLIDAAEVQLQTPILHSPRAVINILASGNAPVVLSTFLAGGNLTALNTMAPLTFTQLQLDVALLGNVFVQWLK